MRTREEELDLEHRILCPDGACIGVIGPDGRCKVCGTFAGNDVLRQLEATGARDDADAGAAADAVADADAGAPADADADADVGADADVRADADADFLAGRELCPDGNCIGVIGANGRCKVCGRSRGT